MTSPPKPYQKESPSINAPSRHTLPTDSFEKFFTVLLRSAAEEYAEAATCQKKSLRLWKTLCQRASLPVPTERVQPKYSDAKTHFELRAALVLEEAREAISRGLSNIHQKRKARETQQLMLFDTQSIQQLPRILTLEVTAQEFKPRDYGITFITFKNTPHENGSKKYFTDEQKQHLLPGQVMECSVLGSSPVLGCVLPCNKERIRKMAEFDLLIFEPLPNLAKAWTLTPVDAFIGPCRQFAACTEKPDIIPFLHSLLGNQQRPYTASDEDQRATKASSLPSAETKSASNTTTVEKAEPLFKVPPLNENQEKAVSAFLESPSQSISIVQG